MEKKIEKGGEEEGERGKVGRGRERVHISVCFAHWAKSTCMQLHVWC